MAENRPNMEEPEFPPDFMEPPLHVGHPAFSTAEALFLRSYKKSADGNTIRYFVMSHQEQIYHEYQILFEIIAREGGRWVTAIDGWENELFTASWGVPIRNRAYNVYYPNGTPIGNVHDDGIAVNSGERPIHLHFRRDEDQERRNVRFLHRLGTGVTDNAGTGLVINFRPLAHNTAERILIVMFALKLYRDWFHYDNNAVPVELLHRMEPIPLLPIGEPLFNRCWNIKQFIVVARCVSNNFFYSDIIDATTREVVLVDEYKKEVRSGRIHNQSGQIQASYVKRSYKQPDGSDHATMHISWYRGQGSGLLGSFNLATKEFGETCDPQRFQSVREGDGSMWIVRRCPRQNIVVASIGYNADRSSKACLSLIQELTINERALVMVVFCHISACYYKSQHIVLPTLTPLYRRATTGAVACARARAI